MKKLLLETEREGYTTEQVYETLTIGELIELLQEYDGDDKIYFSNDNGYTFGGIKWNSIREAEEDE